MGLKGEVPGVSSQGNVAIESYRCFPDESADPLSLAIYCLMVVGFAQNGDRSCFFT